MRQGSTKRPKRKVLLLSNHSLMLEGVARLLAKEGGIEFAAVSSDAPDLMAAVHDFAPAVVVLDTGDPALGDGTIVRLLEELPETCIVSLNLDRTGMDVFRITRVDQTDVEGLLAAVKGRGHSGRIQRKRSPVQGLSWSDW